MLRVDLKTIHNWVNHGHLVGRRTEGRHLRFRRTEVVRFMRQFGHPVPSALGQAPARVLVSRAPGDKSKPWQLGKGVSAATCDGLFAATLELATGQHEICVVDLDANTLPCVLEMLGALRERTVTRCIPMIGLSRHTDSRRTFVARGGDASLAQKPSDLTATVRWLTGGAEDPPPGATIS